MTLPPPGEHGGDAPRVAAALGRPVGELLDLSLSLNPFAPDVAGLVRAHAAEVARYPDPAPATAALAAAMDVDVDRLLLTNGGAEAIALVAGLLPRGRVDDPDFSLYARHLAVVEPAAPRWRSNPHNPTGLLAPPSERAAVWDEAFYPLATGQWTRGDPDAWIVGSLTKLFACPGLRLGYVLAPGAGQLALLRRQQPAWSVNGLAAAILPDLLAAADLTGWRDRIGEARARLAALLRGRGLDPLPSDAPWLLVAGATGLRERLAPHGVLVRDTSSFGLPDHARVAVPDDAGLERLAAALDATRAPTGPDV